MFSFFAVLPARKDLAVLYLSLIRGVRICNLLVVTDELWREEWNPAGIGGIGPTREALRRIETLLLGSLEELNGLLVSLHLRYLFSERSLFRHRA